MLLFALTTAFLFAMIQRIWPLGRTAPGTFVNYKNYLLGAQQQEDCPFFLLRSRPLPRRRAGVCAWIARERLNAPILGRANCHTWVANRYTALCSWYRREDDPRR